MSRSPQKLVAIQHACQRFEACRDVLVAALDRRDSRACLDAFVELCGLHLEQTGGTLVTATYRAQLATLRAVVETRSHLAIVATPQKENPTLDFEIETDADCLRCGEPGLVRLVASGIFECKCSACYDGTPDASLAVQCAGQGPTPRAARDAWLDAQDEHADPVPYWHDDAGLAFERKRQAGWVKTETAEGVWFAPETLAAE